MAEPERRSGTARNGLLRWLLERQTHSANAAFSVDRWWAHQQRGRLHDHVNKLAAERDSDTCVIAGNGPSLNRTDLTLLKGQPLFISNFAFTHPTLIRHATHLAIVNHLVAEQRSDVLEAFYQDLPTTAPALQSIFAPTHLGYALPQSPANQFVDQLGTPAFQSDIRFGASCQSTVTYFLLQLAYAIGYRRVLLIGVDNRYQQPAAASEGTRLHQEGPDPNHFSPSYFQGRDWHAADTDRMAAVFELARRAYEADQREIVDCTLDGALTVFPKEELPLALAGMADRPSTKAPRPHRSLASQAKQLARHSRALLASCGAGLAAFAATSLLPGPHSGISHAVLALLVLATAGATVLTTWQLVRNRAEHSDFEHTALIARIARLESAP